MNKLQLINTVLWFLEDAKSLAKIADYWENEANKHFKRGGYGYHSYMGTSNDNKMLQEASIARADLMTLMLILPELTLYSGGCSGSRRARSLCAD